MSQFKTDFIAMVKCRFENDIAVKELNGNRVKGQYVVQQLHRDDDVVKLWRCGRPGSSNYMFYVCSAPNALVVYGDMGECMWHREYDMIPWLRGSANSLDYFSEKVPKEIQIREVKQELIEEWFSEVKAQHIESGNEWGDKEGNALESLRNDWDSSSDYTLEIRWHKLCEWLYCSELYNDYEDMPDAKFYTYHYLWLVEGLKWFIGQLDSSKVLPYVPSSSDEPKQLTAEITQDISEEDGTLLVFIDTPDVPENANGPLVRIMLNDEYVYANPKFDVELQRPE